MQAINALIAHSWSWLGSFGPFRQSDSRQVVAMGSRYRTVDRAKSFIDRYFHISARGSSVATEIRAGIVTYLTMSYILLVNPQVLGRAGLPPDRVVSSTALTSCIASLGVGLFANLPVGVAPGMGLNAYLVFSQVLGLGATVEVALGCCLAAGVLVALLALVRALTLILALVPDSIKMAVVVGMGLLLSFIGLQTAEVVVPDSQTMVKLGNLASPEALLALLGLSLIATLHHREVPGSIIIGVFVTAIGYYIVKSSWPHQFVAVPKLGFWNLDLNPILEMKSDVLQAIGAYALVMIFDIGGALYGLGNLAGLVEDGAVPGAVATYLSASIGTIIGAFTGTTPLIIAAESAVGIKEGGRTGLVAVTVAACFGISLFFAPILQAVPSVATAPVLVLVGAMMIGETGHINWSSMPTALPAFLTIVIQPFTFSIANGIYAGLLYSALLYLTTGEFFKYVKSVLWPESVCDPETAIDAQRYEPLSNAPDGNGSYSIQPPTINRYNSLGHTVSAPVELRRNNSSGGAASATNIVRGARRIIHDLASSPAYTSTTHDLLIGTPSRPGLHAGFAASAGPGYGALDNSVRGSQQYRNAHHTGSLQNPYS